LAKFLLELFWSELPVPVFYKKYSYTHTKKVDNGSFIKARIRIRFQTSGSEKKVLDPRNTAWKESTLKCFLLSKIQPILGMGSSTSLRVILGEKKGSGTALYLIFPIRKAIPFLWRQAYTECTYIVQCTGTV
jgi:hypothetical protein